MSAGAETVVSGSLLRPWRVLAVVDPWLFREKPAEVNANGAARNVKPGRWLMLADSQQGNRQLVVLRTRKAVLPVSDLMSSSVSLRHVSTNVKKRDPAPLRALARGGTPARAHG